MSSHRKLFALFVTTLVVGMVAGPGMAAASADAAAGNLSVAVGQNDAGEVEITVTEDDAGADGAAISVTSPDGNYTGNGSHTADENGTLTLPEPNETVSIEVTADYNDNTTTVTATIEPAEEGEGDGNADAFGQAVADFVNQLQSERTDDGNQGIGKMVAQFVLENNPGNAPDHAGPPEWLWNDEVDKENGPPEDAGNSGGGPPADKGPCEDDNPNNDKHCEDSG